MHALDDTIAAIASPPGGAARGIVRVSGPGWHDCVAPHFRPASPGSLRDIASPTAARGLAWLPRVHSPLPCELYLWPSGKSYTGQAVAELHTFGSPPLLESLLRAVCASGARLAEPGEFTLRAFLAGRIDLTQAEAVLGVIDAADPAELHVALAQLAGGLARPLHCLRDRLLDLLAHVEAGFDFADEDVVFITPEQLARQLDEAAREVADMVRRMTSRGTAGDLVRVVLAGRPNSGKSSLFNALAGSPGAIVSDQPGTTRDYLTADLDLSGVKCRLIDTAGVDLCAGSPFPADEDRGGGDGGIHSAAQTASFRQRDLAQVEILCLDSTRPVDAWEQRELSACSKTGTGSERVETFPRRTGCGEATALHSEQSVTARNAARVVALTKSDLKDRRAMAGVQEGIATSTVSGEGLEKLREAIRAAVLASGGPCGEVVAGTAVRCRESLRCAEQCLERARETGHMGGGEELVAAEVRVALEQLGKVAGAVYTEDVLDRIFSRFCVGK